MYRDDYKNLPYHYKSLGIKNVGLTCWFNSVLQFISSIEDLDDIGFENKFDSYSATYDQKDKILTNLLYLIKNLDYLALLSVEKTREIIDSLESNKFFSKNYIKRSQFEANEFLISIIQYELLKHILKLKSTISYTKK